MQRTPSVEQRDGYVITEKGRLDLRCAPRCDCNPRLSGLLIECRTCGTIYGTLREQGPWSGMYRDKR